MAQHTPAAKWQGKLLRPGPIVVSSCSVTSRPSAASPSQASVMLLTSAAELCTSARRSSQRLEKECLRGRSRWVGGAEVLEVGRRAEREPPSVYQGEAGAPA